jgi:hypothetical protein
MNITWTISQLDCQASDGLVTTAHWRCAAVDEEHSASSYGTVGFERGDTFVDYDKLTKEEVIGWVKAKLDAEEIESALKTQIDSLKNPVSTSGVPW